MFTKKHYVEVARIIKHYDPAHNPVAHDIMMDLGCMFAMDNPRFDRVVYLKACGCDIPLSLAEAEDIVNPPQ